MDYNTFDNKNSTKNKKSKIIVIILIFFIILLAITLVAYSYFVKNNKNEVIRQELFSSLKNNDLNFFLNNELYQNINKKMENQDFETTNYITLSTTMENTMFSDLDLSKFQFNHQMLNKNKENKKYNSLNIKYAGNDFLTLDSTSNDKEFALKSDEIVNKYVGITKNNFEKTMNKMLEKKVEFSDFKKAKNFILDRQNLDVKKIFNENIFSEYEKLLKDDIKNVEISRKENLVLEADSESNEVTEYTLNFTSEQFSKLIDDLYSEFENDDKLLDELVVNDVKNFDEEESSIIDYKDNENVVEISGNVNNFEATIQIWSANTVQMDPVPSNTITENNDTNPVNVENTVIEHNDEDIQNPILPNTQIIENSVQNNTVNNNTINNVVSDNRIEEEQQEQNQESNNQPQDQEQEHDQSQENNSVSSTIIEEDENLRTQGYISVNDEKNNSEESTFIVGENFEETEKNIVKLTNKINWILYLLTGAKVNSSREDLIEKVQKQVNELQKSNCSLIIKVYVSKQDNSVLKIAFEIPEKSEKTDFQIISKGDKEKYLNITDVIGENSNGYRISIYKKNADADIKNKIAINKISKNKIIEKYTINLETKGTMNSKKYSNNIEFLYSGNNGEFKANIENNLNFDTNFNVDDLNDENCLFIDKLENNDLFATRDAIKQKAISVLNEKNRNLNIIDINNSNSVVQQSEQNTEQEDTTNKQDAKNALINRISDLMREYENEEKTLGLADLEGLEIPEYDVNVSITSNLAIINVNGYTFKLDSEFNLSDS